MAVDVLYQPRLIIFFKLPIRTLLPPRRSRNHYAHGVLFVVADHDRSDKLIANTSCTIFYFRIDTIYTSIYIY